MVSAHLYDESVPMRGVLCAAPGEPRPRCHREGSRQSLCGSGYDRVDGSMERSVEVGV